MRYEKPPYMVEDAGGQSSRPGACKWRTKKSGNGRPSSFPSGVRFLDTRRQERAF